MKVIWATVVVFMLIVGLAEAGQGEVCHSAFLPATPSSELTNDTQFTCPTLGEITIPVLYQQGWRVAHLFPQIAPDMNDPLNLQTAWMIVIEKP